MVEEAEQDEKTCVYGRYDRRSLTPSNPETDLRLRELGWTADDFRGRTVLDIGCNSGLLSVLAVTLGAERVKAIDPVEASILNFSAVLVTHPTLRAKISLERSSLGEIDVDACRSDVVLFMEVLHWAVAQGTPAPAVIERLWRLTKDTLFIEFPWSVSEPSIQAQTELTSEDYSADAILEELNRAFAEVRIVTFVHYFGFGPNRRALVRAARPRPEYAYTASRKNTFPTFALGERSSNYTAPLVSPGGVVLYKEFDPGSILCTLPIELANSILEKMNEARPKTFVAPMSCGNGFIVDSLGRRAGVFPFIRRRRVSLAEFDAIADDQLTDAVCGLREDFRRIELPHAIRRHTLVHDRILGTEVNAADIIRTNADDSTGILARLLEVGERSYAGAAHQLCHCDLQEGNIIVSEDGKVRVVDVDALALGTAFTDGLSAMVWAGAPKARFETTVAALEAGEGRRADDVDCGIALLVMAHWFYAVMSNQSEEAEINRDRARGGLANMTAWWRSRRG